MEKLLNETQKKFAESMKRVDELKKLGVKKPSNKFLKYMGHSTSVLKSNQGSTILEFAIVFPFVLLIVFGILEYNMVMYSESVLQGAVITASRAGKTGFVNTSTSGNCPSPSATTPQTQSAYINCIVKQNISGLMNPSNVEISWKDLGNSFNSSNDSPTYITCTNNQSQVSATVPLCVETPQAAGDIVVYTVSYPWSILTPMIGEFLGTNGVYMLKASAVVKNEPYGTGAN